MASPRGQAGRASTTCGTASSRHATAALAVIVAANGWVASTTASTAFSRSQRRIPSAPPKPPMRTSPTGNAGSGTRPASELDHVDVRVQLLGEPARLRRAAEQQDPH